MASIFDDLSTSNVVISIVVGTLIYFLLEFTMKYVRLMHIGGPPPIPLVGNLYMKDCVTKFQRYVCQLREKYGGLFVFWAANTPFVVVTDAKIMRQALTDHKTFNKGWVYRDKFSVGFGEGLVTIQSGDQHKADRAQIQRFFLKSFIERKVSTIAEETRESIREIFSENADMDNIEILHLCELVTVHTFLRLECGIYGQKWRKDPRRKFLLDFVAYGSRVLGNIIFLNLPTSKYLNPQIYYIEKIRPIGYKLYDDLAEHRLKLREERLAKGEEDEGDCLTTLLDSNLPKQKFYDALTTLICAGFETTAHFGAYTCYLLAKNPDIQKKIQAELKEVMGDSDEINEELMSKLPYLTAVLKESLRLFTIIPSIMRLTTKDVTVVDENGKKTMIPEGTNVMLPFSAINRVDKYWSNPNKFDPERFLNVNGESSAKHGYFPFAYGVRSCIGSTFALTEMKVTLSLLLKRVTLELNPKFKPNPTSGISLVSKNGMKVRARFNEGYNASNI